MPYNEKHTETQRRVLMLKDKNILLCVTGGIAAYKIPNLASMLVKQGCNVNVLMTKNAESTRHLLTIKTTAESTALLPI